MSNVGRQRGQVELQRIRLVAAQHQPAALVTDVDVGVDHAGDRELRRDPGDRLGDQQLMARRHHRQRPAELARRPRAPSRPPRPPPPASRWCRAACARPRRRRGRSRSRWPACAAAARRPASRRPGNSRSAARTARRCSRVGLHVTATMPRSPRMGRRRRASATETKSTSTPTVSARATSRASCSASRSVRAIFSAPLWVKRSGWPVSAVKLASLLTARWARRVSAGVARTWLDSPAARGDVCEARAARSRTTTRAPALGQVIRDAGAEGAGADHDDVGRGHHAHRSQPERLDVVEHGARVQEGRGIDLADEAGRIDQEHLEHVRELPARPAAASDRRPSARPGRSPPAAAAAPGPSGW